MFVCMGLGFARNLMPPYPERAGSNVAPVVWSHVGPKRRRTQTLSATHPCVFLLCTSAASTFALFYCSLRNSIEGYVMFATDYTNSCGCPLKKPMECSLGNSTGRADSVLFSIHRPKSLLLLQDTRIKRMI